VLTLVAATLSLVVGVAVALHLARLSERRRTLLAFVIALPLTFSGLIVAYGFILTYGRAGLVTQLLALAGADAAVLGKALFTPVGLAFASSYYLIPRVVMTARSWRWPSRWAPRRRRPSDRSCCRSWPPPSPAASASSRRWSSAPTARRWRWSAPSCRSCRCSSTA
jgi:hypothetical protein